MIHLNFIILLEEGELPLNLVLGLTSIFIEIQEVQMLNGTYGDMTLYGHATILGGQQVHI